MDVINIKGDKSAIDVFRVLLQFSKKMKENNFDIIEL